MYIKSFLSPFSGIIMPIHQRFKLKNFECPTKIPQFYFFSFF
ncbi:hypothetical protein FM106_31180 [Brachybacterium faecium]|nr:hypothetical protein FM106_31180 [Brachybacterium faecium]